MELDYRPYGEVLLIAGGLLVPDGLISQDGKKPNTYYCIFHAAKDISSSCAATYIWRRFSRKR